MKYFMGIDPGAKSGGWAIIDEESQPVLYGVYSEMTFLQCPEARTLDISLACLEKVSAMPKQGVSSSFNFGENYGWWRGVLETERIPYELVTPLKWMKGVVDSGGRDPDKRLAFARRRWPTVALGRKCDNGVGDGLCLAEYARIRIMGKEAI